MKSFRSIITEAAKPKARVLLFGRMNPITAGHEENVKAAHAIAQRHGAELHVVASHTHDKKKNPLTQAQKTTHLKRAFGHLENTHISTSSPDEPSILHQAAKAHAAGVKHFIVAGGGDRAAGYHKLLHDYNGVEGKSHGYYKFDRITTENTGARKEGVSGTDMRKHAAAGHYDKFKAGLPSKIRSNEKHAHAMYNDVRHGMGMHEENQREAYVSGTVLRLGETVIDNHTGLEGRIVYRGPTYVTVQFDETVAVKRWLNEVEAPDMPHRPAPVAAVPGFKTFLGLPNDMKSQMLNRLNYCPVAKTKFEPMLDDGNLDQGMVYSALDSTAHYLNIEELAAKSPDTINDHAISEFDRQLRQASQMLHQLGVLPEHESYIKQHAHAMMNLIAAQVKKQDGRQFTVKSEAVDQTGDEHLTDPDLQEIERHIDQLEWKDVEYLWKDQEHQEAEEEFELDGDPLDEALSAAQRMKKKINFLKTKSKREIAARVALHRASTPGRLKKRAIIHARTMIMNRLLKGRDKSSLSAAEKDRIEGILSKSRSAVARISTRLLPTIRKLEQQRLARQHEETAGIPPEAQHAAAHLAGAPKTMDPTKNIDGKEHVKKMKLQRKLEV
jgi:hypothetical protein